MSGTRLQDRQCVPCRKDTPPLEQAAAQRLLGELHSGWALADDGKQVSRRFSFGNYYQTMAFVNALAWIAHREDHHPDIEVSYRDCHVHFSTHMIGGLSENDFICAAKIDALLPADA